MALVLDATRRILSPGPAFAEGEEDAVNEQKADNCTRLIEVGIARCHEETDYALSGNKAAYSHSRPDPIADESTANGSGQLKEVDACVSAE